MPRPGASGEAQGPATLLSRLRRGGPVHIHCSDNIAKVSGLPTPTGTAVGTGAYDLPARWVIHGDPTTLDKTERRLLQLLTGGQHRRRPPKTPYLTGGCPPTSWEGSGA